MLEEDGSVVLSLFREADAPALVAADADPEHRRRFDFPPDFVPSLRHSEAVIARWESERLVEKRFAFAVRSANMGEMLGGVELLPLGDGIANLSYWTHPAHRRRRAHWPASSGSRYCRRRCWCQRATNFP